MRRHGRHLSLLPLGIDLFKKGHLAGDALLYQVGQVLRSRVRVHDVTARIGGEELAGVRPAL